MISDDPTGDYTEQFRLWMDEGNRAAIQGALDTELALKRSGQPYSEIIIYTCQDWLKGDKINAAP